ncbi:MAG: TetR/AcrR family transcriptional regulator [Myxococcaceae bacterium]|nr:TetR/AcrR family transcriptional regulator [Myxococcaceae bacterium]MCI0672054.1 TetR/AcrR family transcriptional regulator [Myxococcaceae bacterium]
MKKGEATQKSILEEALRQASTVGLEGLTLGVLAERLELSKSGLFAHFKSKEALQLAVLQAAVEHFIAEVVAPALSQPRGEPRVRALCEGWLRWEKSRRMPGGCIFVNAAVEFDDRPGPVRDALVQSQEDWLDTIARAAQIAVAEGHFRPDLDTEQFANDLQGIFLNHHHASRLRRDARAELITRRSVESLLTRSRRTH